METVEASRHPLQIEGFDLPAGGSFPIEFRDVTFTYPGASKPSVRNLSFRLEPGCTSAVTGPTGSGKTTMAGLMLALFEPDSGEILINNVPSTRYPVWALRSLFGFVPQDGYIFSGTLGQNISFGKPDAAEEDILKAAGEASLSMDPDVFPDALYTVVGEKGVTLSGGQRQRAALARALLMDPPFLILDDTLSAVDANVEDAILNTLGRIRQDKGTLIISHRLTSLSRAKRILVLEDGRITEEGTFDELVSQGGYFQRIHELAALSAAKEELLSRRFTGVQGQTESA
jgi:ATP-binding cassette subfamily B protein